MALSERGYRELVRRSAELMAQDYSTGRDLALAGAKKHGFDPDKTLGFAEEYRRYLKPEGGFEQSVTEQAAAFFGRRADPATPGLLAQGPSWNFSDEAIGRVRAALPGNDKSYQYYRDLERLETDIAREASPVQSTLLEMTGSAAVPGASVASGARGVGAAGRALGRAPDAPSAPMGLVGRVSRNVTEGAAEAGLAAAGESTQTDLQEIGRDAITGALLGGPTGLALSAPGEIGGAIVRGLTGPRRTPVSELDDNAREIVEMGLAREGVTPESAVERFTQMRDIRPETRFGETTQSGAQDLMSYAQTGEGAGLRGAISQEFAGHRDRVTGVLQDTLEARPTVRTNFKNLARVQATKATPLYEEAYALPIMTNDVLRSVMETPAGRKAFRSAQERAANQGRRIPDIYEKGYDLKEDFELSLEAWDDIKQGFDRQYESVVRKSPKRAGDFRSLKNDLVKELDLQTTIRTNPRTPGRSPYKEAREVWAGGERHKELMERGRNVFKEDNADDLLEDMEDWTQGELDAFMNGAYNAVRSVAESKTGRNPDLAGTLINSEKRRDLWRALFPQGGRGQGQYERFIARMEAESAAHRAQSNILQGSKTNPAARGQQRLAEDAADVVGGGTLTGDPTLELVSRYINETARKRGNAAKIAQEASIKRAIDIQMSMSPEEVADFLRISSRTKDRKVRGTANALRWLMDQGPALYTRRGYAVPTRQTGSTSGQWSNEEREVNGDPEPEGGLLDALYRR